MSPRLDLNADVGEHDGPPSPEAVALLRRLTSANIACGAHAGDAVSMRHTILECVAAGVQIGAHPSYPDRPGFGRRAMPIGAADVRDLVARQVRLLADLATSVGAAVRHVKPHGALYNVACVDGEVASAVVSGILDAGDRLALYAPHASALWRAGEAARLHTVAEGFLDRAYEDDGTLTPRDRPGAVLHDVAAARARAVAWARTGAVLTRTGHALRLRLDTLCVHGDTPGAVAILDGVRQALEAAGVVLRPSLADATA